MEPPGKAHDLLRKQINLIIFFLLFLIPISLGIFNHLSTIILENSEKLFKRFFRLGRWG